MEAMEKDKPAPGQSHPWPYLAADTSGMPPMQVQAQPQQYPPEYARGGYPMQVHALPQHYPPGYATGAYPMPAHQHTPGDSAGEPSVLPYQYQQEQQYQAGHATGAAPILAYPQHYQPMATQEMAQTHVVQVEPQRPYQPGKATGGSPTSSFPHPYSPIGAQEVNQPYQVQQPPPAEETVPEGPPILVIILGVFFSSSRIIFSIFAIITGALKLAEMNKDGDNDPVRIAFKIAFYALIAFGVITVLFDIGVIVTYLCRNRCGFIVFLILFCFGSVAYGISLLISVNTVVSASEAMEDKTLAELTKDTFKLGRTFEIEAYDENVRDTLQKLHKCCGVFGPGDYTGTQAMRHRDSKEQIKERKEVREVLSARGNMIPDSCKDKTGKVYQQGCQSKIATTYYETSLAQAIRDGSMVVLLIAGIIINSVALCTWKQAVP